MQALSEISFDLRSGDRLGIVGRNGSGKTTLLRALAGIFPPSSGQITMIGQPTNLININLGIQMQATGHRNITLRGLAAGQSIDEIERRRTDIVTFADLGDFIDLPVATYSSGMRMRLNFAVATAFKPEILILDEWLSAGDANFRRRATERMHSFADQAGIIVLASHSHSLLKQQCDQVLWLEDGRIKAHGPSDIVLNQYFGDSRSVNTPA